MKTVKMYFKAAGVTSSENLTVLSFDDDTITVEDTWRSDKSGEQENGKFDRKTGKCLNDNTSFGSSRTIDPQ